MARHRQRVGVERPSGRFFDYRSIDRYGRRLDQSLLELVTTSFIAGFGIVALAVVEIMLELLGRGVATISGALAFASA